MMKKISILLLTLIGISFAQSPQILTDEKTGNPMLIGLSHRSDYTASEHFNEWFNEEYVNYEVEEEILSTINNSDTLITLECFMGTWCSDSRREVPRIYKILDYLDFDENNFIIVSLNRNKQSPGKEEIGKNIHHVPTLIVYKNKNEIGRIIESPIHSLEEDFADILMGIPPIPNYADFEEE
ncbi:MAG: thioredoxin family protein [Fidelibacterota bacterium]